MSDEPQITSIVSRHSRIRSINNERALHNSAVLSVATFLHADS